MDLYGYERSDGRFTRASRDLLLQRKARYRERNRATLAAKQRRYRQLQESQVIKHGKIHPIIEQGVPHSHLDPIKQFIKRGIADAKEQIVLQPMACDVRGAQRFNGQQCVIAKALTRTMKPQAVAIGRSLAYAVFDGLAIRFHVPLASRKLIEEFDTQGRVRKAPIILSVVVPSQRLRLKREPRQKKSRAKLEKRARTRKFGVRAIGGGITH